MCVPLTPLTDEGDDETTIIFTNNMNRLTRITEDEKPTPGSNEGQEETNQDQQDNHDVTITAYRHTRCTICAKPVSTTKQPES